MHSGISVILCFVMLMYDILIVLPKIFTFVDLLRLNAINNVRKKNCGRDC